MSAASAVLVGDDEDGARAGPGWDPQPARGAAVRRRPLLTLRHRRHRRPATSTWPTRSSSTPSGNPSRRCSSSRTTPRWPSPTATWARFAHVFRLGLPPRDLLVSLLDKPRFQALAAHLGLPVPRAVAVNGSTPDELASLRPPLIVKPAQHDDGWLDKSGGARALPVADREDWERMHPRLAGAGADVLVQERRRRRGAGSRATTSTSTRRDHAGRVHRPQAAHLPAALRRQTALVTNKRRRALPRPRIDGRWGCEARSDRLQARHAGRLHLLEVNPRFNAVGHPGASRASTFRRSPMPS